MVVQSNVHLQELGKKLLVTYFPATVVDGLHLLKGVEDQQYEWTSFHVALKVGLNFTP